MEIINKIDATYCEWDKNDNIILESTVDVEFESVYDWDEEVLCILMTKEGTNKNSEQDTFSKEMQDFCIDIKINDIKRLLETKGYKIIKTKKWFDIFKNKKDRENESKEQVKRLAKELFH